MPVENIEGWDGRTEAGEPVGAADLRGEPRQFQSISDVADRAADAVSRVTDRAAETYETVRARAQALGDQIDPFVQERPYAALGIAALAGLVLGGLLFGHRREVIYVKPRNLANRA